MTAPKLDLESLAALERAATANWSLDHDSDLTMDGNHTPRIVGENSDGSFLTFARGNRNFMIEAELTVAMRNALPALLARCQQADRYEARIEQLEQMVRDLSGPVAWFKSKKSPDYWFVTNFTHDQIEGLKQRAESALQQAEAKQEKK